MRDTICHNSGLHNADNKGHIVHICEPVVLAVFSARGKEKKKITS